MLGVPGANQGVPLELFDLSFLLGKLAFELLNLRSSREIMADGSDKVSSLGDDPLGLNWASLTRLAGYGVLLCHW